MTRLSYSVMLHFHFSYCSALELQSRTLVFCLFSGQPYPSHPVCSLPSSPELGASDEDASPRPFLCSFPHSTNIRKTNSEPVLAQGATGIMTVTEPACLTSHTAQHGVLSNQGVSLNLQAHTSPGDFVKNAGLSQSVRGEG